MHKKDYEKFAQMFKTKLNILESASDFQTVDALIINNNSKILGSIIAHTIDIFKEDNKNFDENRFVDAIFKRSR